MPFVTVPQVLMAELRFLMDSQQVENTLYFQYSSPPAIGDGTALADALFTWWDTDVKPLQGAHIALREIYITDLSDATGFTHARVTSPPEPGEAAGQGLPNNCSTCVTFRTAQRGRSYRGRNYFAGLTEAQVDGNNVQGTQLSNIQGAWANLFDVANALNCNWVVVSRFEGGAPRAVGIATIITSVATIDAVIDSQRRRLPGRGS